VREHPHNFRAIIGWEGREFKSPSQDAMSQQNVAVRADAVVWPLLADSLAAKVPNVPVVLVN